MASFAGPDLEVIGPPTGLISASTVSAQGHDRQDQRFGVRLAEAAPSAVRVLGETRQASNLLQKIPMVMDRDTLPSLNKL